MDTNLRDHFDRAVGDDPGPDPATMAQAAIAVGGRTRRRRKQAAVAAGVVAVLAVVTGVNLQPDRTRPPTVVRQMMLVAASGCSEEPVPRDATDVVVFLSHDVGDRQRSALDEALDEDPRVATSHFDSREQAYERFRVLWADSPDLVASVRPESLPESFRLRLVEASRFAAFRADYAARDGVQEIYGRVCPVSAPVGGVR